MKNFIGQDGFIWWIGKVVDLDDPLSIGRCRVRIFGYHGEERDIPNSDLPWAVAIHPVNTPNFYGTPRVGDFVFGFFLDANAAQEPAMLGYFPYSQADGTKSFSNITSKEDVLLDINGAKISISNTGVVTIQSNNNIILNSEQKVTITGETIELNSSELLVNSTTMQIDTTTSVVNSTTSFEVNTQSSTVQNLSVDGLLITPNT